MAITLHVGEDHYVVDLDRAVDLTIAVAFSGERVAAFGLSDASAAPVDAGGQALDTRLGGNVNCFDVTLNPHGNGTHTECIGHIVDDPVCVSDLAIAPLLAATVVSIRPVSLGSSQETYGGRHGPDDQVVTAAALQNALRGGPDGFLEGLLIRTLVESGDRRRRRWTGTNPPYLSNEAIALVDGLGIDHLLVDLPSLDREDDGGAVVNHRRWWRLPVGCRDASVSSVQHRTITELIDVPGHVPDGPVALSLRVAPLALDAAPSSAVIYPVDRRMA